MFKKFVQTIDLFSVSDSQIVFCENISATISGQSGNIINISANFAEQYNDLKALFSISIPGDDTSDTPPDLSNYKCIGFCKIQDAQATFELSLDEWASMSVTAYVIIPNNQFNLSDKVELA